MKIVASKFATLLVLVLFLMPVMRVACQSKEPLAAQDSMTVWQARQQILEAMHFGRFVTKCSNLVKIDSGSVHFTANGLALDTRNFGCGRGESEVADVRTLESNVKFQGICYSTLLENDGGKPLSKLKSKANRYCKVKSEYKELFVSESDAAKVLSRIWFYDPASTNLQCSAECGFAEKSFIEAINRLRTIALNNGTVEADFLQQAAKWRALASKPPIPEEVRKQNVLAENAVKEKLLAKAMIHYETGLKLYPTWPQGWFNSALIAAELGAYADATKYMSAYLELVPDAQDAQSARDQIVIWQDKAKETK